jgi:hypothetical protein
MKNNIFMRALFLATSLCVGGAQHQAQAVDTATILQTTVGSVGAFCVADVSHELYKNENYHGTSSNPETARQCFFGDIKGPMNFTCCAVTAYYWLLEAALKASGVSQQSQVSNGRWFAQTGVGCVGALKVLVQVSKLLKNEESPPYFSFKEATAIDVEHKGQPVKLNFIEADIAPAKTARKIFLENPMHQLSLACYAVTAYYWLLKPAFAYCPKPALVKKIFSK